MDTALRPETHDPRPVVAKQPQQLESLHKIIVGIDFGTIDTRVAWADSTSPQKIHTIRQWPDAGARAESVDTVPSKMLYGGNGTFKWGYQACTESARKEGKLLEYIKLLLHPDSDKSLQEKEFRFFGDLSTKLPKDKNPVDVVADYLRGIKRHTLDILSRVYGSGFWDVIDIEYCLTTPVIWSNSARGMILKAANQAGIGTTQHLHLVTEPEAVVLYYSEIAPSNLLKEGNTFIILDCGHGTVDVVSYKILKREPTLRVREVASTGALCGSALLNRRFEAFVKQRLGHAMVTNMPQSGRSYRKMMNDFNALMAKFDGSEDQDFLYCAVPGVPDDYLEISREEMQGIFDPTINEIVRLIQGQMDSLAKSGHESISTLLFFGEFGAMEYLLNRIRGQFREIPVSQILSGTQAVAHGAVVWGLQADARGRGNIPSHELAPRNYGIMQCREFDINNNLYKPENMRWHNIYEKYHCMDIMTWLVKKGDELPREMKASLTYSGESWEELRHIPLDLYASNSPGEEAEFYRTDKNVYKVCTISWDASVFRESLKQKTSPSGKTYYELEYNIVLRIDSAQLSFGVECQGDRTSGGTDPVNFTLYFN